MKKLLIALFLFPSLVFAQGVPFGPSAGGGGTVTSITAGASGCLTVTPSPITTTGTIDITANPFSGACGGTGVANTGKTITLGGNLATTGAFNATIALSASVTATWPGTSFTAARTDAGQTFTGTNVFSVLQGTSLALGGATIGANALVVTGPTTLNESVGSSGLTITGATQIANFPFFAATQAWNNAAVTFTGAKINITNTAYTTGSRYLDFQAGGVSTSRFEMIDNGGGASYARLTMARSTAISTQTGTFDFNGGNFNFGSGNGAAAQWKNSVGTAKLSFDPGSSNTVTVASDGTMGFASSTTAAFTNNLAFSTVSSGVMGLGTGAVGAVDARLQLAWLKWGGQSRVSTQFDKTSDTTLADVTGLSVTVAAAKTYNFTATLPTTSNVAGGVKVAIAGTATATTINYDTTILNGGVVTQPAHATALGTSGGITAVTAALITITGTITVNGGGTLTVQFAQNASVGSASSVLVGSTFIVQEF